MKKVKIILSMALSALLFAPSVAPTAMCTAAPTGGLPNIHPGRVRRAPQPLRSVILSNGQHLGANSLFYHNATYRVIESLNASMTYDEWSATMQQILGRVWRLNQARCRYARLAGEQIAQYVQYEQKVKNLQEEIWDILFYLLDHLTFRCNSGYRLDFDDMIMILYYVSGGDVTECGTGNYMEEGIAQGRLMDDEHLIEWASRPLKENSRQFALDALNALWYNTELHQSEWETHVSPDFISTLQYSPDLRAVVCDACSPQLATRFGRTQYTDHYDTDMALMSRISPGDSIVDTIERRRGVVERMTYTRTKKRRINSRYNRA